MRGRLVQDEKRRERWMEGAVLLSVLQLALYLFLHLRPGAIAIYPWIFGPHLILFAAAVLLIAGLFATITRRPVFNWRRAAAFLLLITTITISVMAYQAYPSSHDSEVSSVRFRLPLKGPVYVVWGGATAAVNYHVAFPDQRWAYDLITRREGLRHSGRGDLLEEYYVYNQPVMAPAKGVVLRAIDGEPDKQIGARWHGSNPAGNYVVLEVAPGQFLFLGHLKPGSVEVKAGETVEAGQELGRVGNSGRTIVPHLHIHLQDSPVIGGGEAIPLYFYHYKVNGELVERGIPTGGETEQLVEDVP